MTYMRILRFIFPFIFVRNWHDGAWELSPARVTLVLLTLLIIVLGCIAAYIMQMPISYSQSS